ncbi:hypothetical protein CEXT_318101, partial [Caerostris extrusa]
IKHSTSSNILNPASILSLHSLSNPSHAESCLVAFFIGFHNDDDLHGGWSCRTMPNPQPGGPRSLFIISPLLQNRVPACGAGFSLGYYSCDGTILLQSTHGELL